MVYPKKFNKMKTINNNIKWKKRKKLLEKT